MQSIEIRSEIQDNLYYINRHKDLFDIQPSPLLAEFEAFAARGRHWSLDCSIKVEGDRIFPARFNLVRGLPGSGDRELIEWFTRRVESIPGARLDYGWLDRFFADRGDLAKVKHLYIGVDARREAPVLKYAVQFGDDPALLSRAARLLGDRAGLRDQIALADWWQLNFHLRLDGRSAMELYMSFPDPGRDPSRRLLAGWLPPIARRWPEEAERFGLGIETERPDHVVYLIPRDPDTFIARMGNAAARSIQAFYRNMPVIERWVGFPEDRLRDGSMDTVGLQYSIRSGGTGPGDPERDAGAELFPKMGAR